MDGTGPSRARANEGRKECGPHVEPPTIEARWAAARCALGEEPPDLVISGGIVYNGVSGEWMGPLDIWIKAGLVARLTETSSRPQTTAPVFDVKGMTVLPGLVDAHTHVFSVIGLSEFVRHVLPTGVTTLVVETDELPRILGRFGYDFCRECFRNQPIRFYYTVAPLPGLTEEEELLSPSPREIEDLLRDERCLGLGESYWNNVLLEGRQGARIRGLVEATLRAGKRVEGHSAGARDANLQAYVALGPSSCHESITGEQAEERLRLGLWTMVREGGTRRELAEVSKVFSQAWARRRLVLVTDGQYPQGFVQRGYLDAAVQEALFLGAPASAVYQAVTLNPAEHFGIDDRVGVVAPGRYADLVVIPAPEQYSPVFVFVEGRLVYAEDKALVEPEMISYPKSMMATVSVPSNWEEAALVLSEIPRGGRARAVEFVSRLVTRETVVERRIGSGEAAESCKAWSDAGPVGFGPDVALVSAIDRLSNRGAFFGLVKGFGLRRGAIASTMCWDTGDLLAVACDMDSLRTVVNRLCETGGGAVYAVGSKVVAELPAPICGLVSTESMEVVANRALALEESLRREGVLWENPVLTVSTLGTAAIPFLRVTHRGYVRLTDRALLGLKP